MESYLGDYGGYYPCWPGVQKEFTNRGGTSDYPGRESGRFSDSKTGKVVNSCLYTSTQSTYQTILNDTMGNWRNIATYQGSTKPDGSNTFFAPVKMGMLIYGGYLADFAVLYCPSALGAKDPLYSASLPNRIQEITQVKAAGASDARSLFFANNAAVFDWDNTTTSMMMVRSSYNYRPNVWGHYDDAFTNRDKMWLAGTKPIMTGYVGAQVIPTSRVMAGRALLCDTFERDLIRLNDYTTSVALDVFSRAGGQGGHKEGYNVLYGDGHVGWYGDPQKRVIYWGPECNSEGYGGTMRGGYCHRLVSGMHSIILYPGMYGTTSPKLHQASEVWHLMDNAGGADVGVSYESFVSY
jgi:prepilin-type processing-associated H-X9-DG protein